MPRAYGAQLRRYAGQQRITQLRDSNHHLSFPGDASYIDGLLPLLCEPTITSAGDGLKFIAPIVRLVRPMKQECSACVPQPVDLVVHDTRVSDALVRC